jgi:hypothetical protein
MASRKPSENPNGQSPIDAQDLNQKVITVRTQTETHGKSRRQMLSVDDLTQSMPIAMLRAPAGATIAAMMTATKWQQHSIRGFLAGVVRKKLCRRPILTTSERAATVAAGLRADT